jgi:phosphatidylserine/phosphatidylglycerophosphate/cardiolipin synthase-like enzyme
MPVERLLDLVRRLTQELPPGALEALDQALRSCPPDNAHRLRQAALRSMTLSGPREAVESMIHVWHEEAPDLSPEAIRLALRSAAHCQRFHQQEGSVELVWTGPTAGTTLRRTDQALLQVIHAARRELLLVTFAAYKIQSVTEALRQAVSRRVAITFLAESSAESGGKVTFDAVLALGTEVASRAEVYVWPHGKRPVDETGHRGCLHAKCAVAVTELLFLSSANLTEFALNLNMEMGLLVRGGSIPHRVVGHFRQLIRSGDLVRHQE